MNNISDIINKFSLLNNEKQYDDTIHKYLIHKLHYKEKEFINNYDNQLKEQLLIIDKLIDDNRLLNFKRLDTEIKSFSSIELKELKDIDLLFEIDKNVKLQLRTKSYFTKQDNKLLFNTYQCYFRAAINFFANNKFFIKQFISNKRIKNNEDDINENNINEDTFNNIDSDKRQNGGFYETFLSYFNQNNNSTDALISIKKYLNDKLDNKYLLGIPGYKFMHSNVIQDILLLLKDDFTKSCIFKCKPYYNIDNGFTNEYGVIYDLRDKFIKHLTKSKNLFVDSLLNMNIHKGTIEDYFNFNKCKERFETYYTGYDDYDIWGIDYLKSNNIKMSIYDMIKTTFEELPTNLLFHAAVFDVHDLLMINNVIIENSDAMVSFDKIKEIIKYIKSNYSITCIYPYSLNIQGTNYNLHSFITCVSNDYLDSHFIFFKKENDEIVKYDTTKERHKINKINNKIVKEDRLEDNISNKVVFLCYRLDE